MKLIDLQKQVATVTSAATITLGAAVAPFRTVAAAIAAGHVAVGDSGVSFYVLNPLTGAYETGLYTIADATTLTRESITSSSNGNAAVAFGGSSCEVYSAAPAVMLNNLSGVREIPFSAVIPLNFVGESIMSIKIVDEPMALSIAAGAVRGALAWIQLKGDGVNAPTISGSTEAGTSMGYDKTANVMNVLQVYYDGYKVRHSYLQDMNALAEPSVATAVTMTGSTSGVVGSPTTYTLGTNGTRASAVTVTPTPVTGVTFSSTSVTLPAGTSTATFTATSSTTGTKSIAVTNSAGLTNPSAISWAVAAAATQPGAPTIGTATAGAGMASFPYSAPASDGGASISGYILTVYKASDNSVIGTFNDSDGSPAQATGLTNGVAVYGKLAATNSVGTGSQSGASNSVTPVAAAVLRYGSLTRVVESGTGPYIYVGSGAGSGFGTTEGDSVLTVAMQADVDASFIVKALSTPSSGELFVGVDPSGATGKVYTQIAYGVVGHASTFQQFSGGAGGATTNVGQGSNDQIKVSRVGSTLTMLLSKDGGTTFPTTVGSWGGVPTGVLYIHMLVTSAGSWTPVSATGLA